MQCVINIAKIQGVDTQNPEREGEGRGVSTFENEFSNNFSNNELSWLMPSSSLCSVCALILEYLAMTQAWWHISYKSHHVELWNETSDRGFSQTRTAHHLK